MAEVREYSELKKRAMLAKKRLKMGYWQQLQFEREVLTKDSVKSEADQHIISEAQRARYIRENNNATSSSQAMQDETLYQKVKSMLDENEYTLNPIGQLMDKGVYSRMDEQSKQRYVLELTGKYHELRERYYQERKVFAIKTSNQ